MGCDGGTIPTRDELVRVKKKPEQKDKNSELAFKWRHDAVSQELLGRRVVACELGRLYNKETVLEILLDRTKYEEVGGIIDHIRSLKDIKELKLTENPDGRQGGAEKGDMYIDPSRADYICPVVGVGMSGKYRFCFIWSCGCVLSERALRQVKSEVCHKCGAAYSEEDVIVLNGSEDDLQVMGAKMEARRARVKAQKKTKKAQKHKISESEQNVFKKPCVPSTSSGVSHSTSSVAASKQSHLQFVPPSDRKHNKDIESKLKNGTSRPTVGKLVSSKLSQQSKLTNGKTTEATNEKTSRIQSNPKNSETFKSLFTTHESEKLQEKPHWITFNPQYF